MSSASSTSSTSSTSTSNTRSAGLNPRHRTRTRPQHDSPTLRRPLRIIGVACGLGAPDQGCAGGPVALQVGGLVPHLQARGFDAAWCATIRPEASLASPVAAIAGVCRQLAQQVEEVVRAGGFPIVLGGDHSCAIGTWSGLAQALCTPRQHRPLGLIWIDAHMDAHTPQTTPSGAPHGMPLACLLGHGAAALTAVNAAAPLDPAHVCLIGVRSFEAAEASLLRGLGVRVYGMAEIACRGLDAVLREAADAVQQGTAGFGISVDLDVLDAGDVPGVGTPVPGGIAVDALCAALGPLAASPAWRGLEIVEYNPARDRNGATQQVVVRLLEALFTGTSRTAPSFTGAPLADGRCSPQRPFGAGADADAGGGAGGAADGGADPGVAPLRARSSLAQLEYRFGAHNYDPLPVVLVRGKGAYVWDDSGRRYIDMMSAYSAVSHGHCHPRLTRVLAQQARTLAVTARSYYNDRLPRFLARLCELTGQEAALPVNTGAEAVETALKAARKWGHTVKGIAPGRAEIIVCAGNFHGRTITIVGMSSEAQYRDGFGPFAPGFRSIRFGDAAALERAITPATAAFLVEPVQGEGGIIVPPPGYLAKCAQLCRQHNVLLICDEVQTGLGRTGRVLACQHEGVSPDGLILGKALGGGLLPVSAFLARRSVMDVFGPGDHGSTFGGNPLAAAVGHEALNILIEEDLSGRAATLGTYLLEQLRGIDSPVIREVRGQGLLTGIEIDPALIPARALAERLLAHGVLSKDTHQTVLRLAPPLVISRAQIDAALKRIRATFASIRMGGRARRQAA